MVRLWYTCLCIWQKWPKIFLNSRLVVGQEFPLFRLKTNHIPRRYHVHVASQSRQINNYVFSGVDLGHGYDIPPHLKNANFHAAVVLKVWCTVGCTKNQAYSPEKIFTVENYYTSSVCMWKNSHKRSVFDCVRQ